MILRILNLILRSSTVGTQMSLFALPTLDLCSRQVGLLIVLCVSLCIQGLCQCPAWQVFLEILLFPALLNCIFLDCYKQVIQIISTHQDIIRSAWTSKGGSKEFQQVQNLSSLIAQIFSTKQQLQGWKNLR